MEDAGKPTSPYPPLISSAKKRAFFRAASGRYGCRRRPADLGGGAGGVIPDPIAKGLTNLLRRSGFANDDLVGVKPGNLLIGQGQQFAQDLFVMLAEAVGGDFIAVRPSGKFYWKPGDIEFADRLVPDPPDGSALAQMRMGYGLVQGEDRRGGHTLRFQRRDGRVAARKAAEPALDDVLERRIVVASRPRRVEARIIGQLRHVHRFDHLLPLIRHHHDRDEFVVSVSEHSSGPAVRMKRARALRSER